MTLRIWSWNVNGLDLWGDVTAGDVDVVLLQSCRQPPARGQGRDEPGR